MIVATAVELLLSMPQHLELLIDCSRDGDKGFILKVPESIITFESPADNTKYVLISSELTTEEPTSFQNNN